jgi:hypothetical protein
MISQDISRGTLSARFGCEKQNARGAEYRDREGTANVFAHDTARPIKSDNYFSMGLLQYGRPRFDEGPALLEN